MNNKRTVWVIVFVTCVLAHALMATFGVTWFAWIASFVPLVGAVASFAYLYGHGRGIPEPVDEARRPNG